MEPSNFIPFPYLTTERLNLRPLGLQDESEIFALRSDPAVNKFLDRTQACSLDDARKFITDISEGISQNRSILWAISFKDVPTLIGTICLWNIAEAAREADIGYELLPAWQQLGIISEAMPAVIEFGFKRLHLHTIAAELHPDNIRSIKVLERNKFTRVITHAQEHNDKENPGTITYILRNETYKH